MKHFLLPILFASLCVSCEIEHKTVTLNVASYNLRMDTPADSLLSWTHRKDDVRALIRFHNFDLVGTQEGFKHQLDDLCDSVRYAYTGHGRDDGKDAGEHSAIIYKKERFDILRSGDFWLSPTPDQPGKGWDATCCNRVCSWAEFRDKLTKRTFYLFNVHFDHEGEVARRESGYLMVRKMKEIAGDAPIVCTGDFNSTDDTEQVKTLSAYLNDTRQVSQVPPYGPSGTFNRRFHNPVGSRRIDYIFTSGTFSVLRYVVVSDNNGNNYPSDHLPVAVELRLGEK
ncbi:MAG: endonuclease/exonuclease/phosphatase family protein [Mediterranea sp.]|nr:endonuclease/exonuclease/phosphatase family protein [Mediterranea sp.]